MRVVTSRASASVPHEECLMFGSVSGSVAGMEGSHALRRASSIRRAFTSSGHAGIKRNSVALQVRLAFLLLITQFNRSMLMNEYK